MPSLEELSTIVQTAMAERPDVYLADIETHVHIARAGYAAAVNALREEAEMLTATVESVAQRQMNNSADAAVFAVMVSAGIDKVTVNFDDVAERLAVNRFIKTYSPDGSVNFTISSNEG